MILQGTLSLHETMGEVLLRIDKIGGRTPSGPWILQSTSFGDWEVQRIDCKVIGHVFQLRSGQSVVLPEQYTKGRD